MIALVDLDPRMDDPRMEAGEDLYLFPLRDDRHATHIGTSLKPDDRMAIDTTLVKNADLLAWTAADMPGVDPQVITHRLSLHKEARPIAPKKRHLGEERRQAARDEADKLLQAGFIRKAHYTTWLANVVMVKKANGNGECALTTRTSIRHAQKTLTLCLPLIVSLMGRPDITSSASLMPTQVIIKSKCTRPTEKRQPS